MNIEEKNWFCVTDFAQVVPEEPGCYAIYTLNAETEARKLIYVGTASNLAKRLKKHEVKRVLRALIEYPELISIKCKIIKDKDKRLKTEAMLINRLDPPANH